MASRDTFVVHWHTERLVLMTVAALARGSRPGLSRGALVEALLSLAGVGGSTADDWLVTSGRIR